MFCKNGQPISDEDIPLFSEKNWNREYIYLPGVKGIYNTDNLAGMDSI